MVKESDYMYVLCGRAERWGNKAERERESRRRGREVHMYKSS